MMPALTARLRRFLAPPAFPCLDRSVIALNNFHELKKVFGWTSDPILDRPDIYDFDYVEDVNERRIRDAECLATVMRNARPSVALEIGTATGLATALMSANAPHAHIYTVNIPPEDLLAGRGGTLTTLALPRDQIGIAFRACALPNITQILADTATWTPDIGTIDVAFIDGCHDTDAVYSDTRKVLACMPPGGFILWHDFHPDLVRKYDWIHSVCSAVERLYHDGLLSGRLFHVRDSWIGVYQAK